MIERAKNRYPDKPSLFNEDGTEIANLDTAVSMGPGWGYYDQEGFQSPPIEWSIDTETKTAFFLRVAQPAEM